MRHLTLCSLCALDTGRFGSLVDSLMLMFRLVFVLMLMLMLVLVLGLLSGALGFGDGRDGTSLSLCRLCSSVGGGGSGCGFGGLLLLPCALLVLDVLGCL